MFVCLTNQRKDAKGASASQIGMVSQPFLAGKPLTPPGVVPVLGTAQRGLKGPRCRLRAANGIQAAQHPGSTKDAASTPSGGAEEWDSDDWFAVSPKHQTSTLQDHQTCMVTDLCSPCSQACVKALQHFGVHEFDIPYAISIGCSQLAEHSLSEMKHTCC